MGEGYKCDICREIFDKGGVTRNGRWDGRWISEGVKFKVNARAEGTQTTMNLRDVCPKCLHESMLVAITKAMGREAVLRLLGESAPEMVNTAEWMPPSPPEHEPPVPAEEYRDLGVLKMLSEANARLDAVEGKADSNQDHIEKLETADRAANRCSRQVDHRLTSLESFPGSILQRTKKLEGGRAQLTNWSGEAKRQRRELGDRIEELGRDRRQDAHQIDWLSTRLSVLEGTTGQRLAALEGQAAACAAGECECHDILRLIRHKLEEKRAAEQQSSQMAGGFRAVAYREAIALIDEALTRIKEETDD